MRWLGITAAVVTLIAVAMNSLWFVRRGLGLGGFVSMVWPVALATAGVVGFALVLGFVSVRAMNRSGGHDAASPGAERGAADLPERAGADPGRGSAGPPGSAGDHRHQGGAGGDGPPPGTKRN
ncbi:MAG: hypothetical protein LOD84_00015 [Limnochordales bacterium]